MSKVTRWRWLRLGGVGAFLFLSCIKTSSAFLIGLVPGVGLLFESGTMAWAYAAALTLVGGTLALFALGMPDTSVTAGSGAAPAVGGLEVRINPNDSPRTPAGWNAPTSTGGNPSPPATIAPITTATVGTWTAVAQRSCLGPDYVFGNSYSTTAAAFQAMAAKFNSDPYCTANGAYTWSYCYANSQENLCNNGNTSQPMSSTFVNTQFMVVSANVAVCPWGYNSVGGVCQKVQTDSMIDMPADGGCGIKKSNGQWIKDLRDPDCTRVQNMTFATRRIKVSDTATKRYIYVDIQDDDSTKVTDLKDNNDGTTTKTEYTADSSGKATGATQSLVYGSASGITPVAPTGSVTVGGSGTGTGTGTGDTQGSGSCGGSGQPACAIDDSGFNGKDASGQSALDALKGYNDGKDQRLQDAQTAPGYGSSWFPNLMPGAYTGCRPITFHFGIDRGPLAGFSQDETHDLCQWLAYAQMVLGWFFFVATAFYIFRGFFHSNKGES